MVYLVEWIKNVLGAGNEELSFLLNFEYALEDLEIEGEILNFGRKSHNIRQKWNNCDN